MWIGAVFDRSESIGDSFWGVISGSESLLVKEAGMDGAFNGFAGAGFVGD